MQDRLRLKVMTFDSCQGEERKIIFYSMVATAEHDALNYVFPVELADAEENGRGETQDPASQRRASAAPRRSIWFVPSKPIDDFKGSIAKVLNHYTTCCKRGMLTPERTDANSPMEAKVLGLASKDAVLPANRESVEILPQFPIGDYLRQLDPTYQHPAWRVDFLRDL